MEIKLEHIIIMEPVPTTVEVDGEYYLKECERLTEENKKLKEELDKILREDP